MTAMLSLNYAPGAYTIVPLKHSSNFRLTNTHRAISVVTVMKRVPPRIRNNVAKSIQWARRGFASKLDREFYHRDDYNFVAHLLRTVHRVALTRPARC